MIRFFLILILGTAACAAETDSAIVTDAVKILDSWHADQPKPGARKLHIICWRPNDRDYCKDYRQRLTRIMKHIQAFYRDEMERMGFGKRTFQLNFDADGLLVVHLAKGDSEFADYKKPEGQRVKKDCWPVLKAAGLDPDRETILIFTNLSDWDPVKHTFSHKSPYYASGSQKSGLAWQLDSPELDVANMALKTPMIRDGEYGRISLGKHNSIFIGGIAHELGHGLGLPHCRELQSEKKSLGTALMGSGNRTYGDEIRGEGTGSFITLAHGLRLASHPQFSGSVKGMNLPVKATFSDMAVAMESKHFIVSGKVTSQIPVYAVIAYLDPEGGSDYDAKTVCAVPGADGQFSLDCEPLVNGKSADLRVVACLVNGATSTWRGSYKVSRDGTADITTMQTRLELSDFTAALGQRDMKKAVTLRDGFAKESRYYKIASSIINGYRRNRATTEASEVPESTSRFPLSRVTPKLEKVGWQRPAYNHLPAENPLLVAGGEIFETGIYAHADARHVYDISESGWKSLTGKCGLPSRRGGSVVFVIKTDGKEAYRSKLTKPGTLNQYQVDLNGVAELELITEDGGDGKGGDWGMWFEPELTR